jgi:GTPase SAR1 family protein
MESKKSSVGPNPKSQIWQMASTVDLKVVVLGKENTGKTSLVQRYLHGRFIEGGTSAVSDRKARRG